MTQANIHYLIGWIGAISIFLIVVIGVLVLFLKGDKG